MDLHQFCKEHYFFEVSRRHQLTSALSIPIGVLAFLAGALLVVAKDLDAPLDKFEIWQLVSIAISAIAICITIYFLIRSYFNYSYGYIATSKELKEYYDKLLKYHLAKNDTKEDADSKLENYVNTEYAKYTHQNTDNNDKKSKYLHKANGFLILSLIFTFVACLPYVAKSVLAGPTVHKIEVVKVPEAQPGVNAMTDENTEEPKQEETQTPQQVDEPSPPPGRIIREGENPKESK